MLGLNPLTAKIAGGVAIVVALMAGVIWWQNKAIADLNQSLGGYERQNRQLTYDLNHQRQEANQLRQMMDRMAEVREVRDREHQATIARLRGEAEAARRALQADPDSRVWLDTQLPGGVLDRLCQLTGSGEDGDGVCDRASGHGEEHQNALDNRH